MPVDGSDGKREVADRGEKKKSEEERKKEERSARSAIIITGDTERVKEREREREIDR